MAIRKVITKSSKVADYRHSKKEIDVSLFDSSRIRVQQKNFGWAEVTLVHPDTGAETTFKMRPRQIKSMIEQANKESRGSLFGTSSGHLYSKIIKETKAGEYYTARRQVEGILKVAKKTKLTKLQTEVTAVLKKGDAAVYRWYHNVWLARKSGVDLDIFYEYPEDEDDVLLDIEEV